MSIHKKQSSRKLFMRIKAGILSAVVFAGSVMSNYAGLIDDPAMYAAGEGSSVSGESSAVVIPEGLNYEIELKSNAQWKVTFSGSAAIPANILDADVFSAYRDNIDEVEIGEGISKIPENAFKGLKSLHIVDFGKNSAVTEIGASAFAGCTYLEIVDLENCTDLQTISDAAFQNTGLVEVTIPANLTTIGNSAFNQCGSLTDVHFEKDCKVSSFGDKAFDNCKSLVNVELENCTAAQITFNHSDYTGAFSNCNSLKKVTVPAGAWSDIGSIFRESHSLESVTFMPNSNEIKGIGNIVAETSVDVLDFSPLEGLTNIGAWQVRGNSVTKVVFPSSVSGVGQQAVGDMHALTVVEFKPNNTLAYIGGQMFQNDDALVSVNLEALTNLQWISSQAFENCESLTSVTFPKTLTKIESSAFNNCKGLIDVKYDAANLSEVQDNIFNGAGSFDLTICENVKTIPASFLLQAQDHISGLKFEGTPTFTITGEGDLKEPFAAGGEYTVDEGGNLYKVDGDNAILVYANKTAGEITIPDSVNGHTVTGIAKNAFRNSNVTELTFEKPENITSIEEYAFANAMLLGSINGETIDSEIKALFTSASAIGSNIFYNTEIQNDSGTKITEDVFSNGATPEEHGTAIEIYRSDTRTLNYTVSNHTDETDGKFLTGETAKVEFAYNGGRPVRIYIRADKNAVIEFNDNGISLQETGVDGIYYYDVVHEGASTSNNILSLSYPNFTPPGSKMQVWAVEFDDNDAFYNYFKDENKNAVIYPDDKDGTGKYEVSDKYFEIEWTTKPNEFKLTKTYDSSANPYFIKSSDDKITLKDLKYRVTFTKENAEAADINIGSDIVRYVDYADTLALPEKLKWLDGINTSYTDTHFIKNGDSGTLYINIGGKDYEMFTLSGVQNLVDMSVKPTNDGKISLCWRLANTSSTAEITPFDGYITFGSEVIVADNDVTAGMAIGDINNSISANEYFTFSRMQSDSGAVTVTNFTAPDSKLIFSKDVLDTVTRMGEDVRYKITVENPSAFDYTGMTKITDDLNADKQSIHYIKPENMQALFDEDYGDKLTITISNAVLAKKLTQSTNVHTINKTDTATISEQNTAANDDLAYKGMAKADSSVAYKDVTITLHKNSDGYIELKYNEGSVDKTITIGVGRDNPSIADALDSIGYIVTVSDSYKLEWDFKDYTFEGGKKIEFDINASLKDSLMYLPEKDHNAYYNAPSGIEIPTFNRADLSGDEPDSAQTPEQKVYHDLKIRKGAYIGGEEMNENYQPKDNDVLDYFVKVSHEGSGSYDVLPVVDHMTGKQAVIVEFERNKNAKWATELTWVNYPESEGENKIITIDGVKYYVLNQDHTYNGVYTSEYYADSITVKKTEDGLDTLIKYYIENTPERDFDLDVTYKAITSQELAGNVYTNDKFTLGNEAWLNDRPGHRIYDEIGVSGSAVEIDKKILIGEMKDDPEDEDVVEELPIKQSENQVTYRLMLHSIAVKTDDDGNITDIGSELTVNGNDIFDMLPLTGSAFDWSKDNISNITYKAGEAGYRKEEDSFIKDVPGKFTYNGVELNGKSGGSEWEVKKYSEGSPSEIVKPTDTADQQYIKWNENFNVILPPDATVYMYVTLTFPGKDKDEQWDTFLKEKGTDKLINTFYVYNMPSPVSHTLADPPVALLQKGVYETGTYVTKNEWAELTNQYFIGPDRFHYSNTYTGSRLKNTVTYYVVLRNSGNTNLYLAPLYDILPPGFSYMALRTADGSDPTSNQHVGSSEVYWSSKGQATDNHVGIIAKPKDDNNDDFANILPNYENYVRTKVKYSYAEDSEKHETDDGRQILKFEFENDNSYTGLPYDDKKDAYYLEPGQFLQFAYTCYTGDNEINEAENTIVMQSYDPYNTGASPEIDDTTDVVVKNIHKTAPNNDGGRELWTNKDAENADFKGEGIDIVGDDKEPYWFASSVKVTRDKISPGIKKTVKEPMIASGDKAEWTVTSFNNSPSEISGYKITDTLDLPLQFSGNFNYCMYGRNNNGTDSWYVCAGGNPESDDSYLFNMTRDGDNITVTSNTGDSATLTIGGEEKELSIKTVCNKNLTEDVRAKITVQISHDENNHEVLTIGFPDKKWGMLPNGYSKLTFSTGPKEVAAGKGIDPGTYTNTAMFSPEDNKYDDRITQGRLVKDKDGNNIGVESSAVVSIYEGSPSGSVKMIEEKGKPANFTTSERDDNYISLKNKKDIFTYTLEVRNVNDAESMSNLVIIDNLPQTDDATTLRQESKRESEFKVSLAENPDVQVWLYEDAKALNEITGRDKTSPAKYDTSITPKVLEQGKDYIVEYSDKPNDFNEDDWTGKNYPIETGGNMWYDAPTSSTRSIRIHFTTDRDIEKNQAVQIRFDAHIDDTAASPGQIAWNTFGYSYSIRSLVAKASPNKVGICIPGCPTLSKKVVNSKGETSAVPENTTFGFIIYKSDKPIDFKDCTAKTVGEALTGVDFMYTELTVEKDQSESAEKMLEKFVKWEYTAGDGFKSTSAVSDWDTEAAYHIVELDAGENYSYRSTNNAEENNYEFKLAPIGNTSLNFVNENMISAPVELPSAGGKGTRMFIIGGLMTLCSGAFFLMRNKRKNTKA